MVALDELNSPELLVEAMLGREQPIARRCGRLLLWVLLAQGASGWRGVGSLASRVHTARPMAAHTGSASIVRKFPRRGSAQARESVTSVHSMLLGEEPVIETTGLNRCVARFPVRAPSGEAASPPRLCACPGCCLTAPPPSGRMHHALHTRAADGSRRAS